MDRQENRGGEPPTRYKNVGAAMSAIWVLLHVSVRAGDART